MRQLLQLPDADLEVDTSNTIIMTRHVNDQELRLSLSGFGTGVHQMLVLVTAVLSVKDVLFCIEEPEIHLHPAMQRELIDFLITEPSNRYLLSSHSQTFINVRHMLPDQLRDKIQLFHLRSKNGLTVGKQF